MKYYTATFSNGVTVERTSEHEYLSAGAYIHVETGEFGALSFSKEPVAPPNNRIFVPVKRGCSPKIAAEIKAMNAKYAALYRWESVPAVRIK